MKIGIHNSSFGFHPRWIKYCKEQNIPYKIVNCYSNDIIDQLKDCDALMWHFSQDIPEDLLLAKQLIFSLEQLGLKVFPNFNTAWHFDDKLGQKYLLEYVNAPFVPTYIFFNKNDAKEWVNKNATFPKVFKLRGGAGSTNVKLIKNKKEAQKIINKIFSGGISNYDPFGSLKERYRKYRVGKASSFDLLKGLVRFVYPPKFSKIAGREIGYVYFQDFIPNNDSDTRIIVIDQKAFALKRIVRENDFRASGSGNFKYAREEFDERCIKLAFDITEKLNSQCLAYDFVFDEDNKPKIVEISYGFVKEVYDPCPGYWDKDLNWIEGDFNPYGWMVEKIRKG